MSYAAWPLICLKMLSLRTFVVAPRLNTRRRMRMDNNLIKKIIEMDDGRDSRQIQLSVATFRLTLSLDSKNHNI